MRTEDEHIYGERGIGIAEPDPLLAVDDQVPGFVVVFAVVILWAIAHAEPSASKRMTRLLVL